ncbi:MAG: hypothetical protein ACTXOO_00045 [Sodalis sp. (in: enterobacteria)]
MQSVLGVSNIFIASKGSMNRRPTKVTDYENKIDCNRFLKDMSTKYPYIQRITLVINNLNVHSPGLLCLAFSLEQGQGLYTPTWRPAKHVGNRTQCVDLSISELLY